MKVAVYCGSSSGNSNKYINETKKLGKFLSLNNIDLVYGGASVGLMGTIADIVYGVLPEKLKEKELAHKNITELKIVSDMHERKSAMMDMADAFIALPGGAGTLEEIFEAWTWAQLGYHSKPCVFYNINGFYDKLFELFEVMCESDFLKRKYIDMLIKTDSEQELLSAIQTYKAPITKW